MRRTLFFVAAAATLPLIWAQNHDLGFKDTPMLPGLPYHVHDSDRPHPKVVTPSREPGGPPSDAIVLFDGRDMSHWESGASPITKKGGGTPEWKLENGYFEVVPRTGDLVTKDKFGDVQLHVEWSEPADITGTSQARGNSGVIIMGRYEIQVLDSYNSPTYADGQAGAIYGQWPPLANPTRKPGEWNVYDIVFIAPKFDGDKVVSPAYVTLFMNGVMMHNHQASMGPMVYRQVAHYTPHGPEERSCCKTTTARSASAISGPAASQPTTSPKNKRARKQPVPSASSLPGTFTSPG
jgi:hypothetical protein